MKKYILLLTVFLALSCKDKAQTVKREGEPDIVYVKDDDTKMNLAMEEAKNTLPDFIKAFESGNNDFTNFTVKQKFDTDDGGGEHIWIGDLKYNQGKFSGIIQNVPAYVSNIKLGDNVEIDNSRISDWMYYDKNFVKGGFTVKVMRENLSDEERKAMDSEGLIYD